MSQHGCPERLSNRSKGFQEDGGSQATMEVLVETLTGTAFEMTVSPSDTIFAIKSKIFRVEGIPVSQQHLVYNLRELEDARSLRELGVREGARLRLVLGMRGGPVATRRLPPAVHDSWPDVHRLVDSGREDIEWSGSGCKVTVLVFRDGERVNMVRVRENTDGSYSPLDTNKLFPAADSAALIQLADTAGAGAGPGPGAGGAGALRENAVTMGKMADLRRRMEELTVQRAPQADNAPGAMAEIQKTRSEEALPTHLRDDARACFDHDDYTRFSYGCGFGSRYTLLPPAPDADAEPRLARRQSRREGEGAAILEECLGGEECARAACPQELHPVPQELGELVGAGCAWRGHSASALQLRAGACPPPRPDHAPFSSSTSELQNLQRNSRLLPGLSRARPREHLHLSDEGLHLRDPPAAYDAPPQQERLYLRRERGAGGRARDAVPPAPAAGPPAPDAAPAKDKKIRLRCGWCRKRLSVATVHACRCGGAWCAQHRYAEVHGCAWDYKAGPPPAPPRPPPKLPKI